MNRLKKQQVIDDIIASAKNALLNMTDEEYFEVIIKMIQKYALARKGEIIFSSTDKGRIPEPFEAMIYEALLSVEGAILIVSEETRTIDGGFILVYGDVEENCSFDAIFLATRESLQDKVCKLLFE